MAEKRYKVLVVDDSSYIRKVFSEMLNSSSFFEVVGVARNGLEALEKTSELQPDIVLVDVFMPEMDGVSFIKEQMERHPLPIVACSSAGEDEEKVIEAMEAGAVDFIQKPTSRASEEVYSIADQIVQTLRVALYAQTRTIPVTQPSIAPVTYHLPEIPFSYDKQIDAVVIGISTGGPQALRYLLPLFPENFPVPVAIVIHMPVGYTGPFAHRLNAISRLEVLEASEGLEVIPGRAILARAGYHLMLVRENPHKVVCHLETKSVPAGSHMPSVDVLFRSASVVYGDKTLGIVMTGMGSDGLDGAAWIKSQGGLVFSEAESTSVIFGMPRAVAEAGLSDKIVPLDEMITSIMESI